MKIIEIDIVHEVISKGEQTLHVLKVPGNDKPGLEVLLRYIESNRSAIENMIQKDGAILFRGFDINEKEEFLKVKDLFASGSGFNYVDGNSPRTKLSADVYTSTEYPKEFGISLHSELSYSSKWPGLIFFFCKTPAEEGGETPIADCRHILKELNQELVDSFEKYGVKYTRYLAGTKGVGKTWMDTFETTEKPVVEKYFKENNIEFFWEGESLYLSQLGPGVTKHPVTQERVWFNQANQFHPSGLPDDICRMLKMMYSKKIHKYPQYALYGNGEEIPEAYLKEITDVHFEYAIKFKWQKGDILMLDNMLMAHGRMPFKGERKIYVSMC
jgi:alpha-ketoglutarate-dependent taurine dioxygenase